MKFNSLDFLLLLMATLLPFFALPARWRVVLLITSSMIFYAFWSVPLISLIVISAIIDYSAGRGLERTNVVWKRRLLLLVSMSANLGILGYFKYSNFFLESIHAVLGDTREARYLDIILPPGISFYTFQTMSYTIDVYRRQVGAAKSFMRFFLYVSFFPQLVAGPIERAGHLMTQLEYSVTSRFSMNNFLTGCRMIIWGMFKKVVFADYCALLADRVYTNPSAYDGWSVLVGTLAFTIQIYCDFSAYSEIARGSARMFGVDLMRNFDQPYLASNVGMFWKRWHISLSTWIRDYLFIPLGGSRVSKPRLLFNLTITMFLSGLWHGAAWNFVLWGLYHGALLAISAILAGTAAWAAVRSRAGVVGLSSAGSSRRPAWWSAGFCFESRGWRTSAR